MASANSPARSPVRLLVVDDHPVLRDGLRAALHGRGIAVVGEAGTGTEAVRLATTLAPDVVLMDLNLPEMDGLEATKAIKVACPSAAVLVFTSFGDPDHLRAALRSGAAGFLVKGSPSRTLREAVLTVHEGASVLDSNLLLTVLDGVPGPDPEAAAQVGRLSNREQQVLQYIVAGCSNLQIAQSMHYSLGTIKNTVQRVLNRLGVSDRTQAALVGKSAGLPPIQP